MNIRAVIRQHLRQAQPRRMCVLARNNNESALLHRLTVQGITCRPYPGMYAEKTYWNGLDAIERSRHICRTLAQHHPNMIFSSLSAAALWRLDHSTALHSNGTIYIASTSGRGGSYCNQIKRVHTASRFLDQAVNLDGAKSTDIFRTLFDCGRMLSFRNAFAIFESAIRDGHASRQQIIDYCDEPYVSRKRELAISVAQHAIGISENGGESFCLATMIEEGVALPTQQVEFVHPVSGERRRADYVWHTEDGRTIVGELDGQDKYVNPTMTGGHTISDIVEEERLRSDTLRTCGVDAVVRFTFLDAVRRTPLINKLRAAGIPFTAKPSLPHHR